MLPRLWKYAAMGAISPLALALPGMSTQALEIAAVAPSTHPEVAPAIAFESMPETVLFFETENYAVRIFRRGQALFMNLFDKNINAVVVRETPAELIPQPNDWISYRNTMGEATRYAWLSSTGESRLEVRDPVNDRVIIQEVGYDTVVGVPNSSSGFQGNNFAPGTSARVTAPRYTELRQKPSTDTATITTVPRGDLVDILDRVGNPRDGFIWYQVLYNGRTGWIRGDVLQPV
jgi:hypothetical protein